MATFAFLGNNYQKLTTFLEQIILKTNATSDQEHIKMHIIINNKLLTKDTNYIKSLLNKFEKIQSDYLCLCFDNETLTNFIKDNTSLQVLNTKFLNHEDELIEKIISIHESRG